jgi:hypothetical protein
MRDDCGLKRGLAVAMAASPALLPAADRLCRHQRDAQLDGWGPAATGTEPQAQAAEQAADAIV